MKNTKTFFSYLSEDIIFTYMHVFGKVMVNPLRIEFKMVEYDQFVVFPWVWSLEGFNVKTC